MTRNQYNKNIYQEIRTLNERIDYKILHGQRYSEDSRRHKALLTRITKQSRNTFFSRLFPKVRLFQF